MLGGTSNRVTLAQAITVQSINGPAVTIIQGSQVPGTTNGTAAIRCAYLADGATLSGFTLTSGATGSSSYGGGVYCQSAASVVTNCVITGNSASLGGGGGYLGTYNNCIISGNIAFSSSGGGIYSPDSSLDNCLIISNSCRQYGGGVYAPGGSAVNCTIAANYSGSSGGGIYGGILSNCIVYYNSQSFNSSLGTNIVSATGVYCCCTSPTNNLTGSNNIISPPGFVNVDAGNLQLASWSPCIDAGNNAAVSGGVDLDGNPRIVGSAVDIGAYEYQEQFNQMVHFVSLNSKTPVSPYTNWMTAATNIQNAIDAASAGDYIVVSNGVYSIGGRVVYGQQTNRVAIDQPVTVQGLSGAQFTLIQGAFGGPRCAYLTNGAILIGFTLTNGGARFNGENLTNENGGGVWCESPAATVSNCIIVGNSAVNCGGGSYSGTLINCIFTNNEAFVSGGGACSSVLDGCMLRNNQAAKVGGGAFICTLTNCILSGNSAQNGGGAILGILFDCELTNNNALNGGGTSSNTLVNCLLDGNFGTNNGGGAYYASLTNCTLAYNIATNTGGGAFYCSLTNCALYGNYATNNGGGAAWGLSYNCTFMSNSASECGGGAFSNVLNGCSLLVNLASVGGGVYGSTAVACIISNNTAYSEGGGSAWGFLTSCLIVSNVAGGGGGCQDDFDTRCLIDGNLTSGSGGGMAGGGAYDCIICRNGITGTGSGGGAWLSKLTNCTVVFNWAPSGGGVATDALGQITNYVNCIIYFNLALGGSFDNWSMAGEIPYFVSCCTYPQAPLGSGNITNNPAFLDSMFHLQSDSPCIDAGDNGSVISAVDFDGRPRVVNGIVDIGATEFQGASIEPFVSWLDQYGLPDDGSADYADSDGTGMNNWEKWIAGLNPTNPSSALALSAPVFTNGAPGVIVSWQSVTNIIYYLQRNTELSGGFSAIQSNIVGQAGTTSYTDTSATNGNSFFYRVGVQY